MARQQWAVGPGVLLGLLVLAMTGRADEDAAVKVLEKIRGRVEVDAKRPGKPVVGVDLDGAKATDAELKELKELKSPQSLNLGRTKGMDAAGQELQAARPRLRIER